MSSRHFGELLDLLCAIVRLQKKMLAPEMLQEAYNRKQELCGLTSVLLGSEVGGGGVGLQRQETVMAYYVQKPQRGRSDKDNRPI